MIVLLAFLLVPSARAQVPTIRFRLSQNRITVPVTSSNSTTITNFVDLSDGATNANFDVSGLPLGATFVLTDSNSIPLASPSITSDTNVWLQVNTTNVAEGTYLFSLNAGGLDTNGLPVTNSFPFVLQVAHIWNGLAASNSVGVNFTNFPWSAASNWLNGLPSATSDAVFTDIGAQTNGFTDTSGIPFTNSFVDVDTVIGSLRLSQTALHKAPYHHIQIAPGKTLTIAGPNGFSLLRDYFDEKNAALNQMNVTIDGAGGTMVVSNSTANFSVLSGGDNGTLPVLNLTNLDTFVAKVSRIGIADYQLYPNYRLMNDALNVGRSNIDQYSGSPGNLGASMLSWAKTNIFSANYVDPNNYNNEFTRGYAFMLLNNEQVGIGSGTPENCFLGITNTFLADGICFYGASGNGTTRFSTTNGSAFFRNVNGTSRVSIFTVSDGGGTNEASSNIKGTLDLSGGTVDLMADRFYLSRDRTMCSTNANASENFSANVTFANGTVDVNTAILGYQEHTKPDWTTLNGNNGAYLGYCTASLSLNGTTFKVNNSLTLGYTADTNSVAHALQYRTAGQLGINSNSIATINKVICDGGLNFYDSNLRGNRITINSGGTLVLSNSIGANNYGFNQFNDDPTQSFTNNPGPAGIPLDNLTMGPGGVFTLFVTPGKTNVYVRDFHSTGISPGIIKIGSLTGSFTVYPTNIPLIVYSTATPVLAADMSAIGGTVQGYILNNTPNSTIDLFLTTNAPRTLLWKGGINNNWDLSTTNWIVATNSAPATYSLGDTAIFDDTSTVTNINLTEVVVPSQAAIGGVFITNNANVYTFNPSGGAISGTAKIIKAGTNALIFNAAEGGQMSVMAGSVQVSGVIGNTMTLFTNTALSILSGGIVNGVTSTNDLITVSNIAAINGPVKLFGGTLVNDGNITVPAGNGNFIVNNNAVVTNNADGVLTINGNGSTTPVGEIFAGCVLANFGTIPIQGSRVQIDGTYFGTGTMYDSVNSPNASAFGRLMFTNGVTALLSPGSNPTNSIGNMSVLGRLDMSGNNPQNAAAKFLVEVDTINNVYDTITCVRWNNIGCIWQMTNVNGTFQSGQSFQILVNANGTAISNFVDTAGIYPLMQPAVPGPGLQWNLTGIHEFGTVGVTNSTMIWDGGTSSSWDTNGTAGAWQGGKVYADNLGAVFDDSASGSTTVALNTLVAPAGISVVTVTNVVGTTTNVVTTTNTPAFSPGIVVSNATKDYTFIPGASSNRITGMTSLYKTGSGTLSLLTSNDFTGGMIVDGGTVAITNVSALGISPSTRPAYDQIIIGNATLRYYAVNTNQTLGRPFTLTGNGATFEVSSNGTGLILSPANSGIITGAGALTKTGLGTLVLAQANDTYTGGTIVTNGTLRLIAAAAGSGSLTFSNNTAFEITNAFTLTNAVNLPAAGVSVALQGTGNTVLSTGPWSGGSATFSSTNAGRLLIFNNDITGVGGTISFGTSIGTFRFNNRTNDVNCLGSAAATFDLGTGSALLYNVTRSNLTYDLGALAGGPNTTLAGSSTNVTGSNTSTYRIGAKGVDSTFAGTISNGLDTVSVVKLGAGTLLLNGRGIYTGSTTVSNGALGGTGSIASPLTVAAGGTLSPGAPQGTFTVSNSVSLNGAVLIQLNNSGTPNCGTLSATGTITGGGTLTVTNVGPDIVNGTKFQLFNKAVSGFATTTLPASNPSNTSSYTWQNDVGSDGSITLTAGGASGVNTHPTNMTFSVSGSNLTLTWPGDHLGWQLQSNPISLNSTNWYQIAGSTAVTQENLTVDRSKTNVFFRMIYPPAP
jgi:autotransporter-associated beta strand protein